MVLEAGGRPVLASRDPLPRRPFLSRPALKAGQEPDLIIYSASISACGQATEWVRSLALLEELSGT